MKESVKNYLLKNNINSEEQLAIHILELRRNTFTKPILFELVDLLYNKKSVLLSFFAQKNNKKEILNFTELEKSIITEKEQEKLSREHIEKSKPMFLDEVLERIEKQQPTVTFSTTDYTFPVQMRRGKIIKYNKENGVKQTNKKYTTTLSQENFKGCQEYSTNTFEVLLWDEEKVLENLKGYEGYSTDIIEGGKKETENKVDYSEIDWEFIEGLARRMSNNKEKYEPFNYHKPMDVNLLKQSLLRHTIEILKGEHNDAGQEYGHLYAVALNSMMIYYQLKNN